MKNNIGKYTISDNVKNNPLMYLASQIVLDDGRILENVIKDIEKSISELKKESPYTFIIHNQDEFNDWVRRKSSDDSDYTHVLMYPGEYIFDPSVYSKCIALDHNTHKTITLTGSPEGTTKIICFDHDMGMFGNCGWKDAIISNIDIDMRFTENYDNISSDLIGLFDFQKIENVNLTIFLDDHLKNLKEVAAVSRCKNINNCNFTIKDSGNYDYQRLIYGFLRSENGHGNRVIIETQSDTAVKQFQSGCADIEKSDNSYYA